MNDFKNFIQIIECIAYVVCFIIAIYLYGKGNTSEAIYWLVLSTSLKLDI